MRLIWLDEVDSTNSYLERNARDIADTVMIAARKQSAGHGQRGNSWESAPDENLTFSVLYHPKEFKAIEQFAISEATALAVTDMLALHGIDANVKWPNDIYAADRKICGILIKHSLAGKEISHSIIGVGININQTEFLSDAPNPVSLKQLTGENYDLESLAAETAECLNKRLEMIYGIRHRRELHNEFLCRLWRGDGGYYPFRDTASGENFEAVIDCIGTDGLMTLRLHDGSIRSYRFKEVAFL